ncbi:MAG: single-stranded-DNA-specific exonuclease RecJ [Alphaproteobacteria bacterium]|nr:MAG: single-stranded-DNA-specific exonuclease RecJ [Alphaproteobacteria bacterium]
MAALLAQRHGLDEAVAAFLAGRGVGVEDVPRFLEPKLQHWLPDPFVLRGMKEAAARLAKAIVTRERIAVFGDYDVDGTCSAALLVDFLEGVGADVLTYVPNRMTEGYGPNEKALGQLADAGAGLVITVDCGTTARDPLARARDLGLDVIVLDHHKVEETLPPAVAVVNPNRLDDDSGLGHLCAAGVVFLTLVAVRRQLRESGQLAGPEADLMAGLDLVALATVCDMAPLVGLNRAFVAQGLKVMARRGRPGLAALADVAGLKTSPQSWHLAFLLGPRINAAGRVAEADIGLQLLTTRDEGKARELAMRLDALNRERQALEQEVVEAAGAVIDRRIAQGEDPAVWVVAGRGWHPGVVGIAAQRLVQRFGRPVVVLSLDEEGQAAGSARSIAGVDIGQAVIAARAQGLVMKGGGHPMAAGMTLRADMLSRLEAFFDARLASDFARAAARQELAIDAALGLSGVRVELAEALAAAGPYGVGHPAPRFLLPAVRVVKVEEVGNGHLRLVVTDEGGSRGLAIAFRAAGEPLGAALLAAHGQRIHLVGQIKRNEWQGRVRVDIVVEDAAPAHLPLEVISRQAVEDIAGE